MANIKRRLLIGSVPAFLIIACLLGVTWWGSGGGKAVVVAYTSVDEYLAGKIFREFQRETGIPVRGVFDSEKTKSLGLVNRLLAETSSPQADVFWSGDPGNALLLVKRGIVQPYVSPSAVDIPSQFKSPDGAWTGLAARSRVLLVNKSVVGSREIPSSIHDLANPRWKGQAAIANPMFGTAAFQMASLFTIWGDQKGREFLDSLKANHVRIASSNVEVKWLVLGGEVVFGLLDTDDAVEAVKEKAPVEIVYPDQKDLGTLVIPSAVVLVRGGPNAEGGKKLVDFLLAKKTEQGMVESGDYLPLRPGIPSPPGVRNISELKTTRIDYSKVADEMDEEMEPIQPWLRQWVGR